MRRPPSDFGSGGSSPAASVVTTRIATGAAAGRAARSPAVRPSFTHAFAGSFAGSFAQSVGFDAGLGQLAALRALAQVLGELLRAQRLDDAVLALDSGDHERLAVGRSDRRQADSRRQTYQLNSHPAVRPLGDFLEREHEQPGIGRQGGEVRRLLRDEDRLLRPRALVHLHEVLALARLGDEVAELAQET